MGIPFKAPNEKRIAIFRNGNQYHILETDFDLSGKTVLLMNFLKRHFILGTREAHEIAKELLETRKTTKLLDQIKATDITWPMDLVIDGIKYQLKRVISDHFKAIEIYEPMTETIE